MLIALYCSEMEWYYCLAMGLPINPHNIKWDHYVDCIVLFRDVGAEDKTNV